MNKPKYKINDRLKYMVLCSPFCDCSQCNKPEEHSFIVESVHIVNVGPPYYRYVGYDETFKTIQWISEEELFYNNLIKQIKFYKTKILQLIKTLDINNIWAHIK